MSQTPPQSFLNWALAPREVTPPTPPALRPKAYGPFTTIVADPPWEYGNQSARGAVGDLYAKLALDVIVNMPVTPYALPDAHLYLWTTNAFLADGSAASVVKAWGFEPKTIISWTKTGRLGVGNYFRNTTEHVIFAVRGRLPTNPPVRNVPTSFASPWVGHSRKPEWFYELVEVNSPGPYLELFARREPNGQKKIAEWTRWGNDVIGGYSLPAIEDYLDKRLPPATMPMQAQVTEHQP